MNKLSRIFFTVIFANLLVFANFIPAYANMTATAVLSLTTSAVDQSTSDNPYLGIPINLALINIPSAQRKSLSISQTAYSGSKSACTGTSGVSKSTVNFCVLDSHSTEPVAGDFDVTATLTYLDANNQTQTLSPSINFSVDSLGNISLVSSTPDSRTADQTAPTISIQASTSAPTNRPVVLSAIASDDVTPTDEILYSSDNQTTWSNNNIVTADKNGVYAIFAKDLIGNISSTSYDVENIDTTPPTASVTMKYNPNDNTEAATLTADEPIVAPDGWSTTADQKIFTRIFAKNQLVSATSLRDLAGNTGESYAFAIDQIDDTPPTVSAVNFAKNSLSGSINDPDATIAIVVNNQLYLISPDEITSETWSQSFANLPNGKYEAKIFATDRWNNVSAPIFANFTIENPFVTASISPSPLSPSVAIFRHESQKANTQISPPNSGVKIEKPKPTQSLANVFFVGSILTTIAATQISRKRLAHAKFLRKC